MLKGVYGQLDYESLCLLMPKSIRILNKPVGYLQAYTRNYFV